MTDRRSNESDVSYFETGWTNGHSPWSIALVVTMATFMEVLDTSIANVSLPHIAGNLSVTVDESTWVLTSYLVSNAIVLPISGWIASKVGRKRFYMACVAIFIASSFFCGIAPSLGALVFFRVLQGLGGGGLGPSEQAILADTFPPHKRGMAFAVYGMAVVLAPAIGPTLGGFITDHYSWRWVFFINVPVGLASLLLTSRIVSDPPHLRLVRERSGAVDYLGLSLIAVGLGCLEVVLDKGQEDNWFESSFITTFSAIAGTTLVSFVIWEWRSERPVVDIRLFKGRTFATANIMMLTLGVTLFGSTVILPEYLQVIMGYTAEQAGRVLSPGGFLILLMLPFVGKLLSKVDPRLLIGIGFAILAGSLFHMAGALYPGIDFRTAVLLRTYQAAGMAFLFVPINTLVYAGVPPEKNNAVSGIVNLSRNMGGDIGIAFATTYIARHTQVHQAYLASHTDRYGYAFVAKLSALTASLERAGVAAPQAGRRALRTLYQEMLEQATTLAFIDVLRALGLVTLLMIPLLALAGRAKAAKMMAGH